jgi:PGAP1-like protein
VAGIGSKTAGGLSAALYGSGGELLGYDRPDTYLFSYKGSDSVSLHEPYARTDTFGDIRAAALKLRGLLRQIAARDPGRNVDLIAHSQGGVVARAYLELIAADRDPRVPMVEHIVTFSSPHAGAPLADAPEILDRSRVGKALLDAASWWAHNGGPLPDPRATSVGQLAAGSELMRQLDEESVTFGTRALSLGITNDAVVPADVTRWHRYSSQVVGPRGLNGHDAVVTSPAAVARARSFLRDAPATCRAGWDLWGPRIGRIVSAAERALPWALGR